MKVRTYELGWRLTHVESAPLAVTMESTKTRGPQQGAALMKRTTKYVALDVHQATTSASVREESGRVIARSVLPTDGAVITEFVRGMRGAVHVALEEGTQAQWLHDLLAPLVDRVALWASLDRSLPNRTHLLRFSATSLGYGTIRVGYRTMRQAAGTSRVGLT